MRINKPTSHRKIIIRLAIGGGVAAVMALSIVLWGWQMRSGYAANVTSYVNNTKKEFTSQAASFKSLKDKPDSAVAQAQLATLHASLVKQAQSTPPVPQIFGVPVVDQSEVKAQAARVGYIEKAAARVAQAVAQLKYEHALAKALSQVNGKSGKTIDEQKALAGVWEKATLDVRALSPPSAAKEQHKKVLDAIAAVHEQIAGLSDLTAKNDYTGFIAKQKEIAAKIDALRGTSAAFSELHIAQDKALGEALVVMQSNLR